MGLYTRLSFKEREELSRCFAEGRSVSEAARRIGRHASAEEGVGEIPSAPTPLSAYASGDPG